MKSYVYDCEVCKSEISDEDVGSGPHLTRADDADEHKQTAEHSDDNYNRVHLDNRKIPSY